MKRIALVVLVVFALIAGLIITVALKRNAAEQARNRREINQVASQFNRVTAAWIKAVAPFLRDSENNVVTSQTASLFQSVRTKQELSAALDKAFLTTHYHNSQRRDRRTIKRLLKQQDYLFEKYDVSVGSDSDSKAVDNLITALDLSAEFARTVDSKNGDWKYSYIKNLSLANDRIYNNLRHCVRAYWQYHMAQEWPYSKVLSESSRRLNNGETQESQVRFVAQDLRKLVRDMLPSQEKFSLLRPQTDKTKQRVDAPIARAKSIYLKQLGPGDRLIRVR